MDTTPEVSVEGMAVVLMLAATIDSPFYRRHIAPVQIVTPQGGTSGYSEYAVNFPRLMSKLDRMIVSLALNTRIFKQRLEVIWGEIDTS